MNKLSTGQRRKKRLAARGVAEQATAEHQKMLLRHRTHRDHEVAEKLRKRDREEAKK